MDSTDEGGTSSSSRKTRSRMDADSSEEGTSSGAKPKKTSIYGKVPGEEVGKIYRTRIDLKVVHHPTTCWIHIGPEGPYSILLQGNKRFLDEGSLIVINTEERRLIRRDGEDTDKKKTWRKRILESFMHSLRSGLPIRIIRVIKERGCHACFRYDGVYNLKKKIFLRGQLHVLLRRNKMEPLVPFICPQRTSQIRRMLALKRKFSLRKKNHSVHIKKEIEIKKEIATTSDPENGRRPFCWQQFKEEVYTHAGKTKYVYVDEHNEDWQENSVQIIKGDSFNYSNEEVEESTVINYHHQSIQKYEYYENEEIINLDEQDDNFSKNVIFESIPLVKCEPNDSTEDVRTILAIIPESRSSEFVKEAIDVDVDPLHDPLEQNESKSPPNDVEEKKFRKECSPTTYSCVDGNSNSSPTNHICMYTLPVYQLINAVQDKTETVCPCKARCAATLNFEANVKHMIENRELDKLNLKLLKDKLEDEQQLANIEGKVYNPLNAFLEHLTNLLSSKIKNEETVRLKTRHVITNKKIVKKRKRSTRKYQVSKILSVEESLLPNEEAVHDVSFTPPIPLREDEVALERQLIQLSAANSDILDSNTAETKTPTKPQRKDKSFEASYLGPVIPPSTDSSPRSKKGRLLSKPPCRRRTNRSTARSRQIAEEEEESNCFRGFTGPFRAPSKLRHIQALLKKLEKNTKGRTRPADMFGFETAI